jgi:hypothetical protein
MHRPDRERDAPYGRKDDVTYNIRENRRHRSHPNLDRQDDWGPIYIYINLVTTHPTPTVCPKSQCTLKCCRRVIKNVTRPILP